MINPAELHVLRTALERLEEGFADLPRFTPEFNVDVVTDVLQQVSVRMQDNYPYYHPLYAGQMLKPPHPVARIAYALSLWINPNNHALDGGRASSAMEKECISELGRMFGWEAPLGHLAGGGTMANLEALWIASRLHPGKRVVASEQAHYTHARLCDVLGIPFSAIRCSPTGHMDLAHLDELLDRGDVTGAATRLAKAMRSSGAGTGADQAEKLRGLSVFAARDDLPPLAEDEYYWADLLGLAVVDEAGRPVGRLWQIMDTGAHQVLVVRPDPDSEAGEVLIPLIDRFVPEIDPAAGRIVVRVPEFI